MKFAPLLDYKNKDFGLGKELWCITVIRRLLRKTEYKFIHFFIKITPNSLYSC